jgi:hypothetical protein
LISDSAVGGQRTPTTGDADSFSSNPRKEQDVSILNGILRKREPVVAFRTVDGGHPAPYPDMTDEQLYNYELAFNVPKKTFDRPPPSTATRQRQGRREPEVDGAGAGRQEPTLENKRFAGGGRYAMPGGGAVPQGDPLDETVPRKEAPAEEPPRSEPPDEPVSKERIVNFDGMPALDFNRPIRTVTTKQPVEIITTRARHPIYKVHGYIADNDIVTVFTLDGQLSENGSRFLENVPEEYALYLNIYSNPNPGSEDKYIVTQHASREEADARATPGRLACVGANLSG